MNYLFMHSIPVAVADKLLVTLHDCLCEAAYENKWDLVKDITYTAERLHADIIKAKAEQEKALAAGEEPEES